MDRLSAISSIGAVSLRGNEASNAANGRVGGAPAARMFWNGPKGAEKAASKAAQPEQKGTGKAPSKSTQQEHPKAWPAPPKHPSLGVKENPSVGKAGLPVAKVGLKDPTPPRGRGVKDRTPPPGPRGVKDLTPPPRSLKDPTPPRRDQGVKDPTPSRRDIIPQGSKRPSSGAADSNPTPPRRPPAIRGRGGDSQTETEADIQAEALTAAQPSEAVEEVPTFGSKMQTGPLARAREMFSDGSDRNAHSTPLLSNHKAFDDSDRRDRSSTPPTGLGPCDVNTSNLSSIQMKAKLQAATSEIASLEEKQARWNSERQNLISECNASQDFQSKLSFDFENSEDRVAALEADRRLLIQRGEELARAAERSQMELTKLQQVMGEGQPPRLPVQDISTPSVLMLNKCLNDTNRTNQELQQKVAKLVSENDAASDAMVKNEVRSEFFRKKYEAELNVASQNSKACLNAEAGTQEIVKLLDESQIQQRSQVAALHSQLLGQEEVLIEAAQKLASQLQMSREQFAEEVDLRTKLEYQEMQAFADLRDSRTKLQGALRDLATERKCLAEVYSDCRAKDDECHQALSDLTCEKQAFAQASSECRVKDQECQDRLETIVELKVDLDKSLGEIEDLRQGRVKLEMLEVEDQQRISDVERSELLEAEAQAKKLMALSEELAMSKRDKEALEIRRQLDADAASELEAELEERIRQLMDLEDLTAAEAEARLKGNEQVMALTEELAASQREKEAIETEAQRTISDAEAELLAVLDAEAKLKVNLEGKQREIMTLSENLAESIEDQRKLFDAETELQAASDAEAKLKVDLEKKQREIMALSENLATSRGEKEALEVELRESQRREHGLSDRDKELELEIELTYVRLEEVKLSLGKSTENERQLDEKAKGLEADLESQARDCVDLRVNLERSEISLAQLREELRDSAMTENKEHSLYDGEKQAARAAMAVEEAESRNSHDLQDRLTKEESAYLELSTKTNSLERFLEDDDAKLVQSADELGCLEGQLVSVKSEFAAAQVDLQQQSLEVAGAAQRTIELEKALRLAADEATSLREEADQKESEVRDAERRFRMETMEWHMELEEVEQITEKRCNRKTKEWEERLNKEMAHMDVELQAAEHRLFQESARCEGVENVVESLAEDQKTVKKALMEAELMADEQRVLQVAEACEVRQLSASLDRERDASKAELSMMQAQVGKEHQLNEEACMEACVRLQEQIHTDTILRVELAELRASDEAQIFQLKHQLEAENRSHQLELDQSKTELAKVYGSFESQLSELQQEVEDDEKTLKSQWEAEKAVVLKLREEMANERQKQQDLEFEAEKQRVQMQDEQEELRSELDSVKDSNQLLQQRIEKQRVQMQDEQEELRMKYESELDSVKDSNRLLQQRIDGLILEFRSQAEEQRLGHQRQMEEMTVNTEELLAKKDGQEREGRSMYETQLAELRERFQKQYLDNSLEIQRITESYEVRLSEAAVSSHEQLREGFRKQEEQLSTIRTMRAENEDLKRDLVTQKSEREQRDAEFADLLQIYQKSQYMHGIGRGKILMCTCYASAFFTWQRAALTAKYTFNTQTALRKAMMSWDSMSDLHCRSEERAMVTLYFARWLSVALEEQFQQLHWDTTSLRNDLETSKNELEEALVNFTASEEKVAQLAAKEAALEDQATGLHEKIEVLSAAKAMGLAELESSKLARRQYGTFAIDAETRVQMATALLVWRQQVALCEASDLREAMERLEALSSHQSFELDVARKTRRDHGVNASEAALRLIVFSAFTVWLREQMRGQAEKVQHIAHQNSIELALQLKLSKKATVLKALGVGLEEFQRLSLSAWRKAAEREQMMAEAERAQERARQNSIELALQLKLSNKETALKALGVGMKEFQRLSFSAWRQALELERREDAEVAAKEAEMEVSSMQARARALQQQMWAEVAHAYDSDCNVTLVVAWGGWRILCIRDTAEREVQDLKDKHSHNEIALKSEIEILQTRLLELDAKSSGKQMEMDILGKRIVELEKKASYDLQKASDDLQQEREILQAAENVQKSALKLEIEDLRERILELEAQSSDELQEERCKAKSMKIQLAKMNDEEHAAEQALNDVRASVGLAQDQVVLLEEAVDSRNTEVLYLSKNVEGLEKQLVDQRRLAVQKKQAEEERRKLEAEVGQWEQKAYEFRVECEDFKSDWLQSEAYWAEQEAEQECKQREQLAEVEWVATTEQSHLERQVNDLWAKYQAAKDEAEEEAEAAEAMRRSESETDHEAREKMSHVEQTAADHLAKMSQVEQTAADHLAKYQAARSNAAQRMERCLQLEDALMQAQTAHAEVLQDLSVAKTATTDFVHDESEAQAKEISDLKNAIDNRDKELNQMQSSQANEVSDLKNAIDNRDKHLDQMESSQAQEISDLKNVIENRDKQLDQMEISIRQLRQQQIAPLKEEVGRLRYEEARMSAERDRFEAKCRHLRIPDLSQPASSSNSPMDNPSIPSKDQGRDERIDEFIEDGTTGGTGVNTDCIGSDAQEAAGTKRDAAGRSHAVPASEDSQAMRSERSEKKYLEAKVDRLSKQLKAADHEREKLLLEVKHLQEDSKSSKHTTGESTDPSDVDRMSNELKESEHQRETLLLELQYLQEDLQSSKHNESTDVSVVDRLSKELKASEYQREKLLLELQHLQQDLQSSKTTTGENTDHSEVERLSKELKAADHEREKLLLELQYLQDSLQSSQHDESTDLSVIDCLSKELKAAEYQREKLLLELKRLNEAESTDHSEVHRLTQDLEASEIQREKLLLELERVQEDHRSSKDGRSSKEPFEGSENTLIASLKTEVEQLKEDLKSSAYDTSDSALVESLKKEVVRLKIEREDLSGSLRGTAMELKRVKEILREKSSNTIRFH